jgi:CBS domain-containing protein
MTTEVITIQESAWVAEAIEAMKRHNVHALVVLPRHEDDAYGMVSEVDSAYKVILFAHFHLRRAPVIKGKLLGVVSVTDIMRQAMWWQG